MGRLELDVERVGFVQKIQKEYPNLFGFDTSLPCNSNHGHEYAAGFTPMPKTVDDCSPFVNGCTAVRDENDMLFMKTLPPMNKELRKWVGEYLKTL